MEHINELDHMRFKRKDKLLLDAETAMAWGVPDAESVGYSPSELIQIISRLVKRIKELENEQLSSKAS